MQRWILFPVFFLTILMTAAPQGDRLPDLAQRYQQAQALMSAYQYEQALEALSACYRWDEQNVDYLLKIAYCHQQLGRYGDAKLFYNSALLEDSLNTTALASLGSIYEREANYGRAREYYDQLIEIDTTNSYYFKRRGLQALHLGDAAGGTAFLLRAHQLNGRDMEVIDQLSDVYLAMELTEYAEKVLEAGFRQDPKNIKLLYNKARLHNKRQEYEEVVNAVERAMVQGDTSDYYQMMVGVAYLRIDSLERAIAHLESIVQRKKDTEHTHHYLGLAYLEKEKPEKSETHFREAIKRGISEKMGIYHGDLASVLANRGDRKSAIAHYREAYGYDPQPAFLFHLARESDQYYRDKKIALRYYRDYLNTGHDKFREYAEQRVMQLQEIIHFQN